MRRVVVGNQAQVAAIRARVLDYVTRTWTGLGSWRDSDIDRFVAAVVPVIEGSQAQVAALTDAYLAQLEATVLGTAAPPLGVRPSTVTTEALRGVPASEVYRRPAVTTWTALANGEPLDRAVSAGLTRARDLAATGLQLAKTHTARRVLDGNRRVVGYRRVLEGTRSCALCIVASTQRYTRGQLLPIHGGCDCGVLPVYGDRDPGQVIDPNTLEGVHDRIAERFGAPDRGARKIDDVSRYRDVLVEHEHGELGPVLGVRGQAFTGPDDI